MSINLAIVLLLAAAVVPLSHQAPYNIVPQSKPAIVLRCPAEYPDVRSYRLRHLSEEETAKESLREHPYFVLEIRCGDDSRIGGSEIVTVKEDFSPQLLTGIAAEGGGNGWCLKKKLSMNEFLAGDAWAPHPDRPWYYFLNLVELKCRKTNQLVIY